jgi:hypothetical protein
LVEEAVVERGVLIAPGPVWDAAVRRAEVIGRLAAKPTVGLAAADEAADELGISRRQVHPPGHTSVYLMAPGSDYQGRAPSASK